MADISDLLDFDSFGGGSSSTNESSNISFDDFLSSGFDSEVSSDLSFSDDEPVKVDVSSDKGVEELPEFENIIDDFKLEGTSVSDNVVSGANYKETLLELMEKGVIGKFDAIEVDDKEVSLSELGVLDKDMFREIVSNYIEELKKERLDLNSVSDLTKRVIELDKQGVNIGQVLDAYNNSAGSVKDLDLNDVDNQRRIVLHYLNEYKGYSEKDSYRLLMSYEKEGSLLEEANNAKAGIEEKFVEYTNELEKSNQEAIAKFNEYVSKQKEDFSKEFSNMGLDKPYSKKIVDLITTYDEIDGKKYSGIDKLYSEIRQNPEKMAKLALYLFDENKFIQMVSKEKEKEIVSDTFKKIRISSSTKNSVGNGHKGIVLGGKDRYVDL